MNSAAKVLLQIAAGSPASLFTAKSEDRLNGSATQQRPKQLEQSASRLGRGASGVTRQLSSDPDAPVKLPRST
ncbi:hypothetical protein [Rhodococcus sp. 1168]|uniref:hypothetical protein n=1 Tax=Rhodococcus sp. 1168 TaxID=2018041 RepID=UPI0026B734FE